MNPQISRQRRERRLQLIAAEERLLETELKAPAPSPQADWQIRLEAFPDAWLFDSEKLIRELDRCRELVMAIPNTKDRHATHFQREIAITALWNLRETLRHLLAVQREGQRAFAKKTKPCPTNVTNLPLVKKQG